MNHESREPDRRGNRSPPRSGERGYLPDEAAIRRAEFLRTTPGERVAEAIALSRLATGIAAAARGH